MNPNILFNYFIQELTPSASQNMCQLCSMDKLSLAPPPMYCSSCEARIKQKVVYYRLKDENTNTQHSICKKCYEGSRVCIQLILGGSVSKTNLKSAKNNEEREDSVNKLTFRIFFNYIYFIP